MKKFFIIAVMVIAAVNANAQGKVGSIMITPKLGANLSSMTSLSDTKTKFGLVVGAEGQYQVTPLLALSGGLLYSQQGVSYDVSSGSRKTSLDYLNIPILANFYVANGLALKVGIQPGLLLRANNNDEYNGTSQSTDVKDTCESLDISLPLGLSYEFSNFVIDGRYNLGLTKVPKGSESTDSKNSVIQITLGYRFTLK